MGGEIEELRRKLVSLPNGSAGIGDRMPDDEITSSVKELQSSVRELTDEWTEYLRIETAKRHEDKSRSAREADEWERSHTFIGRHGAKILGGLFTVVSAALAWYGAQIRADIDSENRANKIEVGIEDNKKNIEGFKEEATEDIRELQIQSVNQTIMIQKGFDRIDDTMLKAFPRRLPDREALPPVDPEVRGWADDAARKKMRFERFGSGIDE